MGGVRVGPGAPYFQAKQHSSREVIRVLLGVGRVGGDPLSQLCGCRDALMTNMLAIIYAGHAGWTQSPPPVDANGFLARPPPIGRAFTFAGKT